MSAELTRAIRNRDAAAGCNDYGELMGWVDSEIEVKLIEEQRYREFLAGKQIAATMRGMSQTRNIYAHFSLT